jgi:hypothetical protein
VANELLRFARLATAVARRVVPGRPSRHAGPIHHPASLPAALPVREHLRLTCRALDGPSRSADRLRRVPGLRIVPNHPTLWWFGRRHLSPGLIAAAHGETIERVAGGPREPGLVALDSTGLWLSRASRHFERRARRRRGQRGWLRWSLAVRVGPQLPLAQRARPGPGGDFPDLVPLATGPRAARPFERPVADAGYGSEADHRSRWEDPGFGSLIPAKRRRSVRVGATAPYRRGTVERLGEPGDAARPL